MLHLGRRLVHACVGIVVHQRHQRLAEIGVHGREQRLLLRKHLKGRATAGELEVKRGERKAGTSRGGRERRLTMEFW